MRMDRGKTKDSRISSDFAAYLNQLDADELVRAIVLPARQIQTATANQPPRRGERQAMIEAIKRLNEHRFLEIDELLGRYGGQRLTQQANTLGSVAIETTADGVEAIANLDWVSAVIEDQSIYELP
jgi:hypothetical protein